MNIAKIAAKRDSRNPYYHPTAARGMPTAMLMPIIWFLVQNEHPPTSATYASHIPFPPSYSLPPSSHAYVHVPPSHLQSLPSSSSSSSFPILNTTTLGKYCCNRCHIQPARFGHTYVQLAVQRPLLLYGYVLAAPQTVSQSSFFLHGKI